MPSKWIYPITLSVISLLFHAARYARKTSKPPRWKDIPPGNERVVIIGASSGVGRDIALQYAKRGVGGMVIVGRKKEELQGVKNQCELLTELSVMAFTADCSVVEDVLRLGDFIAEAWGSFDTLIICAGVSSVRPVMEIAGYNPSADDSVKSFAREGVKQVNEAMQRSLKGNFTAPVLSSVCLIPLLLTKQSSSPSILLLSSVASVIPAPTRSLYAATKSASLLFFQSLAIEWGSRINFSLVLPASIEGNEFRTKAVDLTLTPLIDSNGSHDPLPASQKKERGKGKVGKLKREDVAKACIEAVDWKTRTVWLPSWPYRYAHVVYWWSLRWLVERGAKIKYGFL